MKPLGRFTKPLVMILLTTLIIPGTTRTNDSTNFTFNFSAPVTKKASCGPQSPYQPQISFDLLADRHEYEPNQQNMNEEGGYLTPKNKTLSPWNIENRLKPIRKSHSVNDFHFLLLRILAEANPRNVNKWCLADVSQLREALAHDNAPKATWALKGEYDNSKPN